MTQFRRFALPLFPLAVLAGCVTPSPVSDMVAAAETPAEPSTADGIWLSDGYGYALVIDGERLRFLHIAGDVCIEADVEGESIDDIFGVQRLSSDRNVLFLSSETEPYEYRFDRQTALPQACANAIPDTAASNIETLITYLRAHYAFFDRRGVDLDDMAARLRSGSRSISGDSALFDLMQAELARLNDAHVELRGEVDGETRRFDADPGLIRETVTRRAEQSGLPMSEAGRQFTQQFWDESVGEVLLRGNGVSAANNRIRYGMASDDIGYIGFRSVGGFADNEATPPRSEAQMLDETMEAALALFEDHQARAVIVDLSINSGGYNYIALQIAGRFAAQRVAAYGSYAADAEHRTPFPHIVEPASGRRFLGPVYALTSRVTVSGGEVAALALRALPNGTQAGEPTRGALSTKLAKPLPNGWELMLSNEVYLDNDGQSWEAAGIPPAIPITVFGEGELAADHRRAVEQLIATIEQRLR